MNKKTTEGMAEGNVSSSSDHSTNQEDERVDSPGMIDRWLVRLGQAGRRQNHNILPVDDAEAASGTDPFHGHNPPVEDVAVPKAEIVAVSIDIKLRPLVKLFRDSGRTRLPVYQSSLDSPCGFIHLKDLALQHGFNGSNNARFKLTKEMLRPLLYVPGSMCAAALLEQMRAQRIHMALIIDEYGGTDGLVTIEDLVEVIFGDIADEHDDESAHELIREEADGSYLCRARLKLDDLSEKLTIGQSLVEALDDEVDTLGGLIFVLAGRVPVTGEVVRHEAANLDFEIVAADRQLIRQIRVRKNVARGS